MPTSLGLVGIVNKGNYNSATAYVKGNFVYYNHSTWLCIVATATGIEPKLENSSTWQPLAMGINLATFTGATASTAGTGGAVPAPQAGDEGKALMGDGTWDYAGELSWTGTTAEWDALSASEKAQYAGKKVYITDDYIQNIPVMIGASANDGGYKGIVPTPHAGQQKALLRGDGTFGADENLAPPYSSTSTYAVGDLCTNLGKLWKCKTAISTAHAWNASEWNEVTASEAFQKRFELISTYTGDGVTTYANLGYNLIGNVEIDPNTTYLLEIEHSSHTEHLLATNIGGTRVLQFYSFIVESSALRIRNLNLAKTANDSSWVQGSAGSTYGYDSFTSQTISLGNVYKLYKLH